MTRLTNEEIDRIALTSELRGAGQELAHLGSLITGRRAVMPFDLRQARGAIKRAADALDHFERRAASHRDADSSQPPSAA
ncbi:hypothetical protein FFK22_008965 [Mycobacterium sp. KBS0706]|uniref:hypothetical protein n=1 Tax=Mycobacterium sp. KBS0706 TaxID=2578109 RepID=UPI00110FF36C|nr:hypothetical protein [Mycobacterium sp. KBS0706]TSD89100.1 hypothetical protein FFK22_008965 [Mycobacterium sp. KBS0706]